MYDGKYIGVRQLYGVGHQNDWFETYFDYKLRMISQCKNENPVSGLNQTVTVAPIS